jgi:hypothetical protein
MLCVTGNLTTITGDELLARIKELEEENKKLQKFNEELLGKPVGVTAWEKLEEENKSLKCVISTYKHTKQIIEDACKDLKLECDYLKAENEGLKKGLSLNSSQIVDELMAKKDILKKTAIEYIHENIRNKIKIKKLNDQNSKLTNELTDCVLQKEKMSKEIEQLRDENEYIRLELNHVKFVEKYRRSEVELLRKENTKLNSLFPCSACHGQRVVNTRFAGLINCPACSKE